MKIIDEWVIIHGNRNNLKGFLYLGYKHKVSKIICAWQEKNAGRKVRNFYRVQLVGDGIAELYFYGKESRCFLFRICDTNVDLLEREPTVLQ